MTELATVQNLSTGPVQIDPEGHVLGAGEYGTAAHRTDHVRELIRAGLVGVVTEAPSKDSEVDGAYGAAERNTLAAQEAQAGDTDAPKASRKGATTTTAQEG